MKLRRAGVLSSSEKSCWSNAYAMECDVRDVNEWTWYADDAMIRRRDVDVDVQAMEVQDVKALS